LREAFGLPFFPFAFLTMDFEQLAQEDALFPWLASDCMADQEEDFFDCLSDFEEEEDFD
jgi:hypothetical protein